MQASNNPWESWGAAAASQNTENSARDTEQDTSVDDGVNDEPHPSDESTDSIDYVVYDDNSQQVASEAEAIDSVVIDSVVVNDEAVLATQPKKVGLFTKLKDSFSDKKENAISVLFVSKGVYRWYVYDVLSGKLNPVDDPVVTFKLLVWHDAFAFIKHDGNKRAVIKELIRERSVVVKDIKRVTSNWYYFPEDFIQEMRQMGFSKLFSLQLAADGLMEELNLEIVKMLYLSEQHIFAARIISHDDQVIEQTLFNSEEYAIKSIFTNLITTNKVSVDRKHVTEASIKQLIDRSLTLPFWLLEERILSLPIMPVNLSLIAGIGAAAFVIVLLQGTHMVIASNHGDLMNDKQAELLNLQTEFDRVHEVKKFQIPVSLSINFDRFVTNARTLYQPGLKIEGTTDYTGTEHYTAWWLNGKTPLTSFINASKPDGCEVNTKVSGNGEMAYKEINCVYPTNFVGRFSPR